MKILLDFVIKESTDDYEKSIQIAKELTNTYDKPVIFHAYWKGNLSLHHLISITSCYYFTARSILNDTKIIILQKFGYITS